MIDLIVDPKYGYRKLAIVPEEEELIKFYKYEYHESKKHVLDTEARRKNSVTTVADDEWRKQTSFFEAKCIFERFLGDKEKSLLDIGCGNGDFLLYLQNEAWLVEGVDPSVSASSKARDQGLLVFTGSIEEFTQNRNTRYSCINMNNVLEHLKDPIGILGLCKKMLTPGGLIRIKVPNDFNMLQLIANKKVQHKNWWVSIPDHINYFTYNSLTKILYDLGFEVVYRTTDFPMEIFILMGDNYVDCPELGPSCHNKRKAFELSLTCEEREVFYSTLAKLEIGRNIIVYGKLV